MGRVQQNGKLQIGGDLIGYLCRLVCRWMLRGQPVASQEPCPEEEEDGKKWRHTIMETIEVLAKTRDRSSTWSTWL